MSLKSIELQIAIPKTFDAGKQQSQIQQQINAGQDLANEALKEQTEKNHTLLLEAANLKELRSEDERDQAGKHSKQSQNEHEDEEIHTKKNNQAKHPFKGNFIDFSG